MFLIDDFLIWIFKTIHDRVLEELEDTPEKLKRELLDNQLLLETGQISEEEYKKREKNILERLNVLNPVRDYNSKERTQGEQISNGVKKK